MTKSNDSTDLNQSHTPGPWRCTPTEGPFKHQWHIRDITGRIIAQTYDDPEGLRARLMASSAGLLFTLRTLVDVVDPPIGSGGLEEYFQEPVRLARLAISKARGKE